MTNSVNATSKPDSRTTNTSTSTRSPQAASVQASLDTTRQPDSRPCPCCQQTTITKWHQPSLVPSRPGFTMMHCDNKDCKLHEVTQAETVYFPVTGEQVDYHQEWLKDWCVT